MTDEQIGRILRQLATMEATEQRVHSELDTRLEAIELAAAKWGGARKVIMGLGALLSASLLALGAWSVNGTIRIDERMSEMRATVAEHRAAPAHSGSARSLGELRGDVQTLTRTVELSQEQAATERQDIKARLVRIEDRRRR